MKSRKKGFMDGNYVRSARVEAFRVFVRSPQACKFPPIGGGRQRASRKVLYIRGRHEGAPRCGLGIGVVRLCGDAPD